MCLLVGVRVRARIRVKIVECLLVKFLKEAKRRRQVQIEAITKNIIKINKIAKVQVSTYVTCSHKSSN